MPNLTFYEIESLHVWASLLINKDQACFTQPKRYSINFLGEGDSAYLVIDEYTSEDSSFEYLFFAEQDDQIEKQLILIFDFLRTMDYSMTKLVAWMNETKFDGGEMNDRITLASGLVVSRQFRDGSTARRSHKTPSNETNTLLKILAIGQKQKQAGKVTPAREAFARLDKRFLATN